MLRGTSSESTIPLTKLGYDVLAVIHDKDTADIELDAVTLLLYLEEVEWSTGN
jgi:hypothetical protein